MTTGADRAPMRLELAPCGSRPAPAHRDLGRAVLDSALVRGAVWLSWSGHDGIRTLHHGVGLARSWVEKDVDSLESWAALVDGRLVTAPGRDGRTHPVVHTESWEAGATLHAALAYPDDDRGTDEDELDGPEDGLLGEIRTRIRREAAGLAPAAIDRAVADARTDLRTADRYADAGDESAFARAALVHQEWQRIRGETAASGREAYDRDLGPHRAQTAARHRRDVAQCAAEATHDAR
ncbi:hypothetical protein [Kitasatospora sp. NPDC004272]